MRRIGGNRQERAAWCACDWWAHGLTQRSEALVNCPARPITSAEVIRQSGTRIYPHLRRWVIAMCSTELIWSTTETTAGWNMTLWWRLARRDRKSVV